MSRPPTTNSFSPVPTRDELYRYDPTSPIIDILPSTQTRTKKDTKQNASTAAQAAGVRAFTAQAVAFYFRAPVKAFFRTRVDYLTYARHLQAQNAGRQNDATSRRLAWLRSTTPGVIASAVRAQGWKATLENIVPPLFANVTVGAVLYTSYLQILGYLHEESSHATKRVFPPPSISETATAGLLAGGIQSLVAAPLDAIQVRYERHDAVAVPSDNARNTSSSASSTSAANVAKPPTASAHRAPPSMYTFGRDKLREIGARGIFAGWSLSFMKDSLGSAVFFSTFEYVKAQGYYSFISWYYGNLSNRDIELLAAKRPHPHPRRSEHSDDLDRARSDTPQSSLSNVKTSNLGRDETALPLPPQLTRPPNSSPNLNPSPSPNTNTQTIKPPYFLEPTFLFLAGILASIAQQSIIYPLHHIQIIHWEHLESLDSHAKRLAHTPRLEGHDRFRMLQVYYKAYAETWEKCKQLAGLEARGSLRSWAYRGFWWNTVRQVPSTSAGLIIFELVRRRYGDDFGGGEVRIQAGGGGYEILAH